MKDMEGKMDLDEMRQALLDKGLTKEEIEEKMKGMMKGKMPEGMEGMEGMSPEDIFKKFAEEGMS